jgi:cupin 2 domain-containing protein
MQGPTQRGNLLVDAEPPADGERFETLARCRNVAVERILSSPRPDAGEYRQAQDEWVALLQGRAVLELAGEPVELVTGDWLLIPAGTPHRVIATSGEPPCLWLAVHIHPEDRAPPLAD